MFKCILDDKRDMIGGSEAPTISAVPASGEGPLSAHRKATHAFCTMTTTVIIDDTDSSISYSDGWTLAGVSSARSSEYNSTVHIGSSNGLELTFSFSGMAILTGVHSQLFDFYV